MNIIQRTLIPTLVGAAIAVMTTVGLSDAFGQSQISPVDKWSWGENSGWTNWYDDGVTGGANIEPSGQVLSGYIWNENLGWLYLGDGSPDFGPMYGNATATDTGVNISASGNLTGFAWGEQIGWINYGLLTMVPPPLRARIIRACPSWRFTGFAWSESVGWINLTTTAFSALTTNPVFHAVPKGDLDFNGMRNGLDIQDFTRVVLNGPMNFSELVAADMNSSGRVDNSDVGPFVECILNGNCVCP